MDAIRKLMMTACPTDFTGVGVFDYEIPLPSWDANVRVLGATSIYINKSIELVLQQHPDWSPAKINAEAKRQFDASLR